MQRNPSERSYLREPLTNSFLDVFGSNARLDVGLLGGPEAVYTMIDTRDESLYIGDPSGGETRTELAVPAIGTFSRRAKDITDHCEGIN